MVLIEKNIPYSMFYSKRLRRKMAWEDVKEVYHLDSSSIVGSFTLVPWLTIADWFGFAFSDVSLSVWGFLYLESRGLRGCFCVGDLHPMTSNDFEMVCFWAWAEKNFFPGHLKSHGLIVGKGCLCAFH